MLKYVRYSVAVEYISGVFFINIEVQCCYSRSNRRLDTLNYITCVALQYRRGGGVGFLVSKQFKVNLHSNPEYSSFESISVEISDSSFQN